MDKNNLENEELEPEEPIAENESKKDNVDKSNENISSESLEKEYEGKEQAEIDKEEPEIEKLKEQLKTVISEKEELTNLLQRVKADFDNYRRRTRTEKEEAGLDAVSEFIVKLLPVMDNIERAMDSAQEEGVGDNFIEGLKMIKKQIDQVLEQEGVTTVGFEGEEFDPCVHEAVMRTEEGEGAPNTVVEVFQKGYLMKGRVLRPAMVKVKLEENEEENEENIEEKHDNNGKED